MVTREKTKLNCVAPLLYNPSAIDGSCAFEKEKKRSGVYEVLLMLKASGEQTLTMGIQRSLQPHSPEGLAADRWLSRHLTDTDHSLLEYVYQEV